MQFSNFVLATFHYEFYAIQKQLFSKHGGWNHSSISKPEFLEVRHTDYYNHISLINNIVSENKLEILAEFDNSLQVQKQANDNEIEQFINEKSGETITANTEKKITSSSRNTTNETCQVNFVETNIENCYRSGCQALQNKKKAEEINFLRDQINEKNFIISIRNLFELKLSNHEGITGLTKLKKY